MNNTLRNSWNTLVLLGLSIESLFYRALKLQHCCDGAFWKTYSIVLLWEAYLYFKLFGMGCNF